MKSSIKQYLTVGRSLTVLKYENREGQEEDHKGKGISRKINYRQTNAIRFDTGSWLYFGPASQSEWVNEAEKIFRVWDIQGGEKILILTYKIND